MNEELSVEVGADLARTSAGPVDPSTFRRVLGHFPSGVVIVSGHDELGPVGLTCQSFFSLSLEPPLVAIAPGRGSTSWPRIARTGSFAVSVLGAEQERLCLAFAASGVDKFRDVSWRPGVTGSPIVDGALAWVDCRIDALHDGGDHHLVTGAVLDAGHAVGRPLVFFRGAFVL
ncbi:MAG: 3-hydroxy-9,10-secoandrosta,3,5(10)-triene-9,17-dione monooxygenase reductase component [Microbacteriaceae bacterium]|jgi:flavin reductase (DIM6/NTAB) family NADH-FMN oxidoreductase RutF|nr:3-hydroxy-9,10-secoandrosta,3,5(10)-triene-9,17-dione monooxygenase reductase component [Microbacteriaceae bacterium]